MKKIASLLALGALISAQSGAQTQLENQDAIRAMLGTKSYDVASTIGQIKVAVLDNGFLGYTRNSGLLPQNTTVVNSPVGTPAMDPHGLGMAQILWAATGHEAAGPEIYLINTNGFSNLKSAIDYVIKNKIQIVLYAQTWDFGGNFDGKGFINAQVNRATENGVAWINAAGNIGGSVYDGAIEVSSSTGYVKLPGDFNTLRLSSRYDSNPVTFTLCCNDYTESENDCTKKDLDLYVYNDAGTLVAQANKIQKGEARGDDPKDTRSCYAREEITLPLGRGDYTVKIQARSSNFGAPDRLRLVIASEQPGSVDFKDKTSTGGEIGIPADNPNVITVGDCSEYSASGPTSDGRLKPDVSIEKSETTFTDGRRTMGSSNAAAMVAGAVAVMMAREPLFDAANLKSYVASLGADRSTKRCGNAPLWRTPSPQELIQITK